MEIMSTSLAAKLLIAESLPDPIPLTKILIFLIFNFFIAWTMFSATFEAANGVPFFVFDRVSNRLFLEIRCLLRLFLAHLNKLIDVA